MLSRTTSLLIISAILLLWSCNTQPDSATDEMIAEKAEERLRGFREKFQTECRERVLEEALSRADVLLRERARRLSLLAGRPPKPTRPGAPQEKQLSKALPLRPLFPFEIRFDTLLRDSLLRDSLRLDSLQLLENEQPTGLQ